MDVKIADNIYLSAAVFEKVKEFCAGDDKLAKTIVNETVRVVRALGNEYSLFQHVLYWQAAIVEDLRRHDLKEGVANVT